MSYPDTPGYKTPGASKEAAIAVRGQARVLRKRMVAYLKSQYPRDFTADEIAEHFGGSACCPCDRDWRKRITPEKWSRPGSVA